MRRYAVEHQTSAGTNLTMLNVIAATTTRGRIYDLLIGSDATPADVATEYQLIRTTAVGTGGTALTGRALDPGDPAALITATGGTFSVQPTKTASSGMLNIALNQRATFRWVAVPDGELVIPATSGNGIAIESIASGGTPNTNVTVHWQE
jgi:hypothetical protein